MAPWRRGTDHLAIAIRLTPKAADNRIEGRLVLSDGNAVLAVKVRAVPEQGHANDAAEKLIASAFGVARSQVHVIAGKQARMKRLRIDGDPGILSDIAERLWPGAKDED